MKVFQAERLQRIGEMIFKASGVPAADAELVTEELVEASLMGFDSHGIIRFIQYAEDVLDKKIKPGAEIHITKETENSAVVHCGMNFGIIAGLEMIKIALSKASSHNISAVVSTHCYHVGRLGAYVQKIADQGMFALAVTNSSRHGHWVAPWGGMQGRLATNPLAYAFPGKTFPVVFDMSTSAISEGKIRLLMHQGQKLPPHCVLDAAGKPTEDPNEFYGPPKGTILPFGGEYGYKGFGLGLLVELLGSTLAGVPVAPDGENDDYVNGFFILVINPDAFGGTEQFRVLSGDLADYITSAASAAGSDGVLMPGTRDFRTREDRTQNGIPVADDTWHGIRTIAQRVGVNMKELD